MAAMWSRYRDNVARHLIGISRDLQARVQRTLSEDLGYRGLRPSFGPFLSLLWDEGRPLAAIADDLAISRQACSQLANHVEEAGYLERRANPGDRRSKLVVLTDRGRELVSEGVRIILESESEYAALVGARAYRHFTSALTDLFEKLGLPTHADPALLARARESIGVLPLVAVRIQRELLQATAARGHAGLKTSHGELLPLIGPDGERSHVVARIQGVSRQAVHVTARDLESLGYLRREPDPSDRRGVVLRLTARGTRLIRDSVAAVDGLERSFADVLGEARLDHLERVARDLHRALHLEDVFQPGDIQELATRLRRQLGSRDVVRLAELLEPVAGETAT